MEQLKPCPFSVGQTMNQIKGKCRYCGGNLFTHVRRDLNIIGEQGYTVSLKCEDCGMKMSLFASSVDMIPTVESKLLKIYGIKGE